MFYLPSSYLVCKGKPILVLLSLKTAAKIQIFRYTHMKGIKALSESQSNENTCPYRDYGTIPPSRSEQI